MLESYHNIRIVVVGTSCSGKTTLARKLSGRLEIPHIEMDALYWDCNWTERPKSEFIKLVENAVTQKSWVIDGNYRIVRDIVWGRANFRKPGIFYYVILQQRINTAMGIKVISTP